MINVIRDHSALQIATRRLVQLLEDTRQNRDAFIETFTLLQQRFDQLEMTTTVFCENSEMKSGRSVKVYF